MERPAGKLFIIGGGKRPAAMVKELVELSKIDKEGYGIILPMSSEEPDSSVYYAKIQFADLGITNVTGMNFTKDQPATPQQLDSIKGAHLIYISGGDQNKFMQVVYQTPIEVAIKEAFKNGSVVAGTSAGAAVMSKKMITGNELKYPLYEETFRNIESNNIEIKPGLGLIETAIIDQHFIKRSRYNRLICAVIEYPGMLGIGIDESTAIIVEGDSARVTGESQVILFRNPDHSQADHNGLLGANDLRLDVLLPGAKFSLSNK
ncbi:Cyanophycinase [Fulvivirga imtechensis AK7]|uniref:Cyanophycinase n=2 Tax=Fulvivirga TaxID=396811 RepID=L8JJ08_9BACT|nr:Cyanophycinase [Fulvivirga imtechensis AK7]